METISAMLNHPSIALSAVKQVLIVIVHRIGSLILQEVLALAFAQPREPVLGMHLLLEVEDPQGLMLER
jgi:hypothetical protein